MSKKKVKDAGNLLWWLDVTSESLYSPCLVLRKVQSKHLFFSQYVLLHSPGYQTHEHLTFSHKEAHIKDNVKIISERSVWSGPDRAGRADCFISCAAGMLTSRQGRCNNRKPGQVEYLTRDSTQSRAVHGTQEHFSRRCGFGIWPPTNNHPVM